MVTRTLDFPAIGIKVLVIGLETPGLVSDIMKYLDTNELLSEKGEAWKVNNRAAHFMIIDGVLYKKGFFKPLLRCVSQDEAYYILAKVHEGNYDNCSSGKALAMKVMTVGYY